MQARARDQIRIVGSSTVFPFATAVAERFGKGGEFKTPIVESTGTGGGVKLFCAGLGAEHPDIANASRELTDGELESCAANGVTAITEIKIGFDGIVIANNVALPPLDVTLDELYLALAKEVPNGETGAGFEAIPTTYRKWSEIDPALPRYRINVYGPPPTSGTRDAFIELVMQPGCLAFAPIRALKESGPDGEARAREVCQTLRADGAYIEAGENDDLIVQKLEGYPIAFGIFGYGFLLSERRHVARRHDQRRAADLRVDRRRHLPDLAAALRLRQERAAPNDSGHARVPGRVHQRGSDRSGRLPGGQGPGPAAAGATRGVARSTRRP